MKIEVSGRNGAKARAAAALGEWLARDLKLGKFKRAQVSIILSKHALEPGCCHELIAGSLYSIVLDSSKSMAEILQTLCHEFVHLKQFLTGKLTYNHKGKPVWCGKEYCFRKTEYLEQPWEIQAFKNEILLFRRATEYMKQGA